MLPQCTEP